MSTTGESNDSNGGPILNLEEDLVAVGSPRRDLLMNKVLESERLVLSESPALPPARFATGPTVS